MLHFTVQRRLRTAEEADHLAWQQPAVVPATLALPGVALLHSDHWYLHEEP